MREPSKAGLRCAARFDILAARRIQVHARCLRRRVAVWSVEGERVGRSEHPSTQHESCRSQRPDCVSLSVHHVVRRVRGVHQHRHRGRVPVDGRSPWRRGQVSRDQWAGSLWPVLVATYSGPARPAPSALIAGTLRARTRREPTARSKGGPRLPRTRDLVAPGRVGAAACRRPRRAWASEKKKP